MNKLKAELKRIRLALLFALVVFAIITLTAVIMFAFFHIRSFFGIEALGRDRFSLLVRFSFFNIIAGTIIAAVFSRLPLSPLRKLITAADRLSNGDFGVRIHLRGIRDLQDLSDSFNHMAEELGSIEMLRADFVNNFSHEFKTPIVSVRGFAKVLKRGDLSDSEREEYLDIIISESERLSALAENVLSLSRLETQTILTHKERFNVSEQLRQAVVLLESKWTEKSVEIAFDCGEIYADGNKDLIKQIWINLLDNAIKFSPERSVVSINVTKHGNGASVTIADEGHGMDEATASHIFDKFFQGDVSHSAKGNGLGLSVAKRIIELHGGTIRAESAPGKGAVFVVEW